ncbi:baseplate J/gp47 family protein [Halomonas sp. KAO]|uniref:baseplate J/gp47 family protein n=1 Tax=Halomonas sp. KAO TaxID=2783858 RepID=UPI0018A1033A|nr:baseplate J/gp47 family protein [Halomonas sp. KAO]MBF7051750.1 baseplate J/gp47 family protein [Halomonas sp. KAO]
MLIPGQNRLAAPAIVETPPFEDLLERFKLTVVDAIAAEDPALAAEVEAALANEAEVATKLLEAATVILQTQTRHYNEQIQQMLAWWAKDSNLDAKVADLGLKRQTVDEGDPDAFPPVPPEMEDDESLRLRYFLAPYSFSNAGPQLAYRYHALTLGNRPEITVDTPEEGVVVVTHRLPSGSAASWVKDALGKRTAPGAVTVAVLSREGNGAPSAELLAEVENYFARDDVAPVTDDVTVSGAEILPWSCQAVMWINRGPDIAVAHANAVANVQAYADEQHRLGGHIETTMLAAAMHNAGAVRVDIATPADALVADDFSAPYCTGIDIEVRRL